MKITSIIATAAVGAALVVVAAAVTVLPLRGAAANFSVTRIAETLHVHAGMLGAVFVIAFGVLVFVICFAAAYVDLSRARVRLSASREFGPQQHADSIRLAFAGTSIETVAARLDDALGESSLPGGDPDWVFYWPRVARLEIWRVMIRRVVGLELVTVLLYAFYAAAIAQFGPSQVSLDLSALPWPNLIAAVAILVCGGWLWIDDTIESVIAEMGPFRRRQITATPGGAENPGHPTPDLLSAIAAQGEQTRNAEEAMFARVAALFIANKEEILTARSGENQIAGADGELKSLLRSISDHTLRMVSQITRVATDQEKAQSAMQKRDADAADMNRRWTDFGAKLDAIEAALQGFTQAAPADGTAPITIHRDTRNIASARAVATNLEAILADMKGLAASDPNRP